MAFRGARAQAWQARGRFITLVLLSLLFGPSARADNRSAAASGDASATAGDTEYDALIKRALAEFELGHWTEAKAFFQRAHQLRPNARTLRGLGVAAYELRSYVEALTYLRQALASQERPLTEEMRAQVKATLEEAKSFIAYDTLLLEPQGVHGVLGLNDVTVRVDGQPATFDDDGTLLLDSGQHEIELQAPGFEPLTHSLTAKGGERAELRLALHAQPALVAAPSVTPVQAAPAQATHDASLWSTPRKVALVIGVAGVVAVGIGTTFGIMAMSANSASKRGCTNDVCDAKGLEQRNSALAKADAATVAFVAGGVLIGAGVTLFLLAPPRRESATPALSLQPVVGPRVAALALTGRF